jgi:hypothetical protein
MSTILTCGDPECHEILPCEDCAARYLAIHDPEALNARHWQGVVRIDGEHGIITDRQRSTGGTGTGSGTSNAASDKQVAFLSRLAAERGITVATEGLSKSRASAEIERLLALPVTEAPQARWKKVDGTWGVNAPGANTGDTVTVHKASGDTAEVTLGERLSGDIFAPAKDAPATKGTKDAPATVVDGPGMYATADDRIVKVQASQAGRLYGKVLNGQSFDYSPGAMRDIVRKLTLEEAAAYGRATGICCCCGRTLTNPESIAAGIGPICAGRF